MTTQAQADETIYQLFVDNFTGVAAGYIDFENEDFTPPSNASWVRLVIRHTSSEQDSLGDVGERRYYRSGIVIVQCFTPQNGGRKPATLLATEARDIFEGVTTSGQVVTFNDASIKEIGVDKDGWFCMNMEAGLSYLEIK